MITEALLGLGELLLGIIAALLPAVGPMPWDALLDDVDVWAHGIGAMAGPADQWLPISDAIAALDFLVTVWLPPVLVFLVVRWVYAHLPDG